MAVEHTVVSRFAEQVALYGRLHCVRHEGRTLTFADVDRLSNCLSRVLIETDGRGNRPVAALLDDGVKPLVALLGTLKAGKCHVPMAAEEGQARLECILSDSTAQTLIIDSANIGPASRLAPRLRVVNMDKLTGEAEAPGGVSVGSEDLAIIMYTSGSTGRPKGVMNTIAQFTYSVYDLRPLHDLNDADRMGCFASFAFAGGVKRRLRAAFCGATVCVGGQTAVARMPEFMAQERITWLSASPSTLRHLMSCAEGGARFPDLRYVSVGHEPLFKSDLARFRELFGQVKLCNVLGTTESSQFRSYLAGDAAGIEGEQVPVGYAICEMETLLLGDDLRPVGPGQAGQIAVKGPALSSGYWRRSDLTAERFVTDPRDGRRMYLTGDLGRMLPDGCLIHLGRVDFQVKIRAYRVELGEVEAALASHPDVAAATAAAREDAQGELRLVAYYVAREGTSPTASALRRHLVGRLPESMIPSAFVPLDAMPVTPRGKVDRSALPDVQRHRPLLDAEYVPPRTPVEEVVAAMWSQVLDVSPVGVEDDFFDLGGHSLKAAMVLSRILERFGVQVPIEALVAAPTVAATALAIVERLAVQAGDEEAS